MASYFTIIYVKTNRFSDEKVAVGLLANINDLPEFHYSDVKLNFALKYVKTDLSKAIKRSLSLLVADVNQFVNGETSIPMFEAPYARKLLEKLTLKKRGILYYGELQELQNQIDYKVLFQKYIAVDWATQHARKSALHQTFKKRFSQHVLHRRFSSFSHKVILKDDEFPLISVPLQVDLLRQKNGFTLFKSIDFQQSERLIQQQIASFRLVIESLTAYSVEKGLSKGRYYLVYESPKEQSKSNLVLKIKSVHKGFELIRMSEMADKI